MGITKNKIASYSMLLLLAIFPFGQLPGIFLQDILGNPFRIHLLDIILIFIILFTSNVSDLARLVYKYRYVYIALVFTSVLSFSLEYFSIIGIFYLIRFLFYVTFFLKTLETPYNKTDKQIVLNSLVVVGGVISILGWLQYLFLPDLIALKYFGWDDHYYRLTSTFLDPAFTGILITLSALLTLACYLISKNNKLLWLLIFFIATLGFTYSRASFLAFLVGIFIMLAKTRKKLLLAITLGLFLLIVLLPNGVGGEGVKLMRTSSISQKIDNYEQSLKIINSSPLFGVGLNNICKAKEKLDINNEKQENSCSGLDNSFLFIWGTTGILGLFSFSLLFYKAYKINFNNSLWTASFAAVFAHTLFTNTLLYPWVMIWLALITGTRTLRSKV